MSIPAWIRLRDKIRLQFSHIKPRLEFVVPLSILASLDLAYSVLAFSGLPIFSGLFSFGDLAGLYTYSPFDPQQLGSLAIYPIAARVATDTFGAAAGQNFLFLATFFFPSIGVFFFLREIRREYILVVSLSFAFGTIANPVEFAAFVGGAFEYGFWAFFMLLSATFLLRSLTSFSRLRNYAASGLCFGLSITQVAGISGLEFFGALTGGVFLTPLLLLSSLSSPSSWKMVGSRLSSFFGVFLLTSSAILATGLVLLVSVAQNPAGYATARGFVFANVNFTYRYYQAAGALFSAPPVLPNVYWQPDIYTPWIALVCASLAAGAIAIIWGTDSLRRITLAFLASYLISAGFIAIVATGAVTGAFRLPILDFLETPFPMLYMQALLLPPLFYIGTLTVLDWGRRSGQTSSYSATAPFPLSAHPPKRSGRALGLSFRKHRRTIVAVVIAAVPLLCSGVTLPLFAPNPSGLLEQSPFQVGQPFFGPTSLPQIHTWFTSLPSEDSGLILPLPNTFALNNQLWAYIPKERLWTVPYSANALSGDYNSTSYVDIVSLLASNDTSGFAYLAATAGLEFILVMNVSAEITLVPGYLSTTIPLLNLSYLNQILAASAAFNEVESSSSYSVYADIYFGGLSRTPTNISAIADVAPADRFGFTNYLVGNNFSSSTDFATWIRYPQPDVFQLPNGTVALLVNSSSAVPYSIFVGSVNLTAATSPAVRPPPLLNQTREYSINLNSNLWTKIFAVQFDAYVPNGLVLDPFIYWYNSSTDPPLFSEFLSTYLGPLPGGTLAVNVPFEIPAGAVFARLYFYAHSGTLPTSGEITLYSASVSVGWQSLDFAQNPGDVITALNESSASAYSEPLVLFPPFLSERVPPPVDWISTLQLYSPAVFSSSGSSNLILNGSVLAPFSCGCDELVVVSLRGQGGSGNVGATVYGVNGAKSNFSFPGVDGMLFSIAERDGPANQSLGLTVHLYGNMTLSSITITTTESSSPSLASVGISLPIGVLNIHNGEDAYSTNIVLPQQPLSTCGCAVDYLPILTLIGVLSISPLLSRFAPNRYRW